MFLEEPSAKFKTPIYQLKNFKLVIKTVVITSFNKKYVLCFLVIEISVRQF